MFFRCGNFIHRPGDNDLLHVDIWKDGHCIAGDTGSFSYNSPVPFVKAHNTISVDGLPQMKQLSRFLKEPARCELSATDSHNLSGYHCGYEYLKSSVRHERHISVSDDKVIVEDSLITEGEHTYELTWVFPSYRLSECGISKFLLSDGKNKLGSLTVSAETAQSPEIILHEGNRETGEGFVSPHYNSRIPAQVLTLKFSGTSLKIRSTFEFCP